VKCPHCTLGIAETWHEATLGAHGPRGISSTQVNSLTMQCPACQGFILVLKFRTITGGDPAPTVTERRELAYPRLAAIAPPAPEVPEPYRTDCMEAAATLPVSAQASAAISRRCLQAVLRDKAGTTSRDLNGQLDEVLSANTLPSDLAEDVDAIRHIGNFAAHQQESNVTGLVLPVEPGEAEWSVTILEALLDFYFVRPAKAEARRAALNAKLAEAGKPPLKAPPSGTP
jgi:hypothetical protein